MALVDAHYCFLYADVGCQGRISDGGVYKNTSLYQKIVSNELPLPPDAPLRGRRLPMPYVLVADDAFPLTNRLLKPFPGCHPKGSEQRIFNYRLSRARRIVENAFGIMVSVFRVFRSPMMLQPDNVATITMTCVLLHNFLRKSDSSSDLYAPPGSFDSEQDGQLVQGTWRTDGINNNCLKPFSRVGRKATIEAQQIRQEFANYFSTNGKVSWQHLYT